MEIDGEYKANAVFISRRKVLTIAFVLYKPLEGVPDHVATDRIKIVLPSNPAMSTDNMYGVNQVTIPDEYINPSYQANYAILTVSYY